MSLFHNFMFQALLTPHSSNSLFYLFLEGDGMERDVCSFSRNAVHSDCYAPVELLLPWAVHLSSLSLLALSLPVLEDLGKMPPLSENLQIQRVFQ